MSRLPMLMLVTALFVGLLVWEVFAMNEKCCICQRRKNKSEGSELLRPSANYESYFAEAFGVSPNSPVRNGYICLSCHLALMRWIKFRKPANKVSYLSRQSSITRFKGMVNLLRPIVLSVPERDKSKNFCLLLPEDSFHKTLPLCCFLCLTPFSSFRI